MELIPSTPAANPVELPVPDDAQEEGEGVFDLGRTDGLFDDVVPGGFGLCARRAEAAE